VGRIMNAEGERRFVRFPDSHAMSRFAADLVLDASLKAVERFGVFTLVASGGKTPGPLYRLLVEPPYHEAIPWNRVHLFWGDERCVPPDNPASNYLSARLLWNDASRLNPDRVHRIRGELPAKEAAAQYEDELRDFFLQFGRGAHAGELSDALNRPVFDLVLLGMGADGHVASLFPGKPATDETSRWVASMEEPEGDPPVPRVTLTFPVINNADVVIILATGPTKAHVIEDLVFHRDLAREECPAARVAPGGTLYILFAES
jgi:6-phosphogluconolactonase